MRRGRVILHLGPQIVRNCNGIELELIELVHRRGLIADPTNHEAEALDVAIDQTLERLGDVVTVLPESV